MKSGLKTLGLIVSTVLTLSLEIGYAMKPALPEKFEFQSEDKKFKLVHVPGKDPYVSGPKGKWVWKGADVDYPSEVILAPEANRVYFIGGYGDPGVLLGVVSIYDMETGKLVKTVDIKNQIVDLEARSRAYRDSTNFPWVTSHRAVGDGSKIQLRICDEVTAEIDSKTGDVTLSDQLAWFEKIGCEQLEIKSFKTLRDRKPERSVKIVDPDYIRSLQVSINQLRKNGDVMIDMSEEASLLTLEFQCGKKKESVEFYDGRIKTPATSFYERSDKSDKVIWQEMEDLFGTGAFDKPVPYYVGREIDFGDFRLTYKGSRDETPKGTTASRYVADFQLKSKNGKEDQTLSVMSGQLPPRPLSFEVGKHKYTLYTFSFKDERIDPRHLVVEKHK